MKVLVLFLLCAAVLLLSIAIGIPNPVVRDLLMISILTGPLLLLLALSLAMAHFARKRRHHLRAEAEAICNFDQTIPKE
ncbi:MAG TPA: hypothetical protein VKV40_10900 [Ktedonobacteraceae bacterium]|nr:hypothetical protein [Ktedonobacteraceae bacterium]